MLERSLADEANAWDLQADGRWRRRVPADGRAPRSVHRELMALHAERAGSPVGAA